MSGRPEISIRIEASLNIIQYDADKAEWYSSELLLDKMKYRCASEKRSHLFKQKKCMKNIWTWFLTYYDNVSDISPGGGFLSNRRYIYYSSPCNIPPSIHPYRRFLVNIIVTSRGALRPGQNPGLVGSGRAGWDFPARAFWVNWKYETNPTTHTYDATNLTQLG